MGDKHKATIETLINTAALALTSFGIVQITKDASGWEPALKGAFAISFGAALEFFKYWGRSKKLW